MKSRYVMGFCVLLLSVCQAQAQWRASTETGIHETPGPPQLEPLDFLRPLRRIHVLITADTGDENIGDGVRIDMENMEDVFRQFVPDARQLNLRVLDGDELTIENISRSLAEFRLSPADAFVFLFSGHGCHNEQGHFFCMSDGECLYRSDIVKAMQGTGIRLVAVLSNGCNVHSETAVQHQTFDLPPAKHDPTEGIGNIAPLFDELFLKPYGVVDINGASEGEMTSASPPRGSTSLRPLYDCFLENRDGRPSWQAFVGEYREKVCKEQERLKSKDGSHSGTEALSEKHTPKVWSLPNQNIGPRFGVVAVDNDGDGVRLIEVWHDYPATRVKEVSSGRFYALEQDDVILSVNDVEIHGIGHFFNAVMGSPGSMELTVRNWRDGQVNLMTTLLRY